MKHTIETIEAGVERCVRDQVDGIPGPEYDKGTAFDNIGFDPLDCLELHLLIEETRP